MAVGGGGVVSLTTQPPPPLVDRPVEGRQGATRLILPMAMVIFWNGANFDLPRTPDVWGSDEGGKHFGNPNSGFWHLFVGMQPSAFGYFVLRPATFRQAQIPFLQKLALQPVNMAFADEHPRCQIALRC